MSHEIYYTSAPEGLKRGSSGFCTVAASAEIPKALWDRLETLSAYRHHFATGGRAEGAKNPVSHAHWILNVTGRTYHVLSRVADAGVDHTQRTNSFAHHLVVEREEMQAAAGGPAWLLEQPGVMAEGWDGRPNTLARSAGLARGDSGGSRICRAWEALTGDAGWGGHLADAFVKAPTRPVCVLFPPGLEMLPLVAEAIALLPPGARWNVTFNTYFTSMPTATCLWRFCLAGTPAAEVGLRYASGGLVLNLAERSGLPVVPAGPYVTMARTGQAPEPAKAEAKVAAEKTSKELNGGSSAGNLGKSPKDLSQQPEMQKAATLQEEAIPLAAEDSTSRADMGGSKREISANSVSDQDIRPAVAPIVRGMLMRRAASPRNADWTFRAAEDALEQAEYEGEQAARRRRSQVALLFGGAILALGVGTGVIYWVHKRAAPPPVPERSQVPEGSDNNIAPPEQAGRIASGSPTSPKSGVTSPTQASERESPRSQARVTEPPASGPVIPGVVTLTTMLERPNLGMGIGDSVQTLGVPAGTIGLPGSVTALRIRFPVPPVRAGLEANAPGDRQEFKGGDLGLLVARPETRMGKPGLAVRWRPSAGGMSEPVEALFIGFDRVRPGLEVQWHAAALLKNPGIMSMLYWVLQNSSIELSGVPRATQQIRFQAFDATGRRGGLDFGGAGPMEVNWPVDLPREVAAVPPVFVPLAGDQAAGPGKWEATWYTDWEVKDAALRSASNASQVIKFKKATSAGVVDAWFLITFRPGLRKIESTFATRNASDEADLARFESELRALNMQIEEAKANNNGVLGNSPGALDLQARRDQTQVLINAYKEAVAGYNELTQFDVAFDLPDGVRLAALHFARPAKVEAGK